MSPCLTNCPNELIEAIVELLDLDDIRNLRQSCRSLAAKCTQNRFKSYYRSKRVELTPHALRAFVDVTQPGRLGCLVQELTLVGLTEAVLVASSGVVLVTLTDGAKGHDSKQQHVPAETELDLLSQAFSGIARKSGKLRSLSLEVEVVQVDSEQRLLPADVAQDGWKPVWQSAAQTFHITMDALAASNLPLQRLDVFNNRQSQVCSLACDELVRVDFQNKGLAISLSNLKSLSISLSDRIIEGLPTFRRNYQSPKNEDIREAMMQATALSNFVGLGELLQLTRLLDSLEIHYYKLDSAHHLLKETYPYAHHERLLKQVVTLEKLPKLKQCRLRGIYTDEGDLLAFIQRTAARRFFMENVMISLGRFKSVFDYCTGETAGMEELYFDNLIESDPFETHELLHFRTRHQVPHENSAASLHRVGAEVKQPIDYHHYHHHGRVRATRAERNVLQQQIRDYGPPHRFIGWFVGGKVPLQCWENAPPFERFGNTG